MNQAGRRKRLDISDLRRKAEVLRERQRRYGDVVIPQRKLCQGCGKRIEISKMPVVPHTGAVRNAADCLCESCRREYADEIRKVGRLVCVGCREVLALVEPGKEKRGGFVWEPGRCYHVANCPACAKEKIDHSPVVEKLMFYTREGIPYC